MTGLTLDSGALIGLERADRKVVTLLRRAIALGVPIAVPAGVVGQVWRNGARQARLARLLRSTAVEIEPLDDARARAAGQLCGVARTDDVIDASVALCARRRGHCVLTADVEDIRRLDPTVRIEAV